MNITNTTKLECKLQCLCTKVTRSVCLVGHGQDPAQRLLVSVYLVGHGREPAQRLMVSVYLVGHGREPARGPVAGVGSNLFEVEAGGGGRLAADDQVVVVIVLED